MSQPASPLLPSGFMDVLPPLAAAEFRLIYYFFRSFTGFGYEPVIPPLAEYAESILAGQGEATSHHVLRLNDPLSPRLLGIRADMTGQIARIAASTLAHAPRPLRLCYGGYTLRAAPEALKTRRQHTQVGIERFGGMQTQAIAEVLAIAVHALSVVGVEGITIDLTYPCILKELLDAYPPAEHAALHDAVRMKDSAQLRQLNAALLADIIDASGPCDIMLPRLRALQHPAIANAVSELQTLTDALAIHRVNASFTVDMFDLSGYGYYSGIGYVFYWNQASLEVGRGGCYHTASGEEAVGFTLYINDLLEALGREDARPVKPIPYSMPASEAAKLQAEGYITVYGAP